MPEPSVIEAEKLRLYESPALREDINDDEASILLKWGEEQVLRLAGQDGDFEKQCQFLRQLIKHINRFVGQREYNDEAGQSEYMEKVVMWLPRLGFPALTAGELMVQLPPNAKDMAATLRAILNTLTPPSLNAGDATLTAE